MKVVTLVWERLEQLLFRRIDSTQYAILRVSFGFIALIYLIELTSLTHLSFGPDRWLLGFQVDSIPHQGRLSLFDIARTDGQARAVFMFGYLAAICFTIGWRTRVSGGLLFLVLVSIWNRDPLVLDGDDALLRIMVFYLVLSPSGSAWSFDAIRSPRDVMAEIWPLRLIQCQIVILYFISGWVKFLSPQWLDGTILQFVLIHPEYSRFDWSSVVESPSVRSGLAVAAHGIRWWELLFPVLIALPRTRRIALVFGVIFHSALAICMNLRSFPYLMLLSYFAFIPNSWFRDLRIRIERYFLCEIRNGST